jgi:hypothetical protein
LVDNAAVGTVFEDLIRKFAELSSETASEHSTLREVIRLMMTLQLIKDDKALQRPGTVCTLYGRDSGHGAVLLTPASLALVLGAFPAHKRAVVVSAYFSPSWTAFQTDGGRDFNVIVDGVPV